MSAQRCPVDLGPPSPIGDLSGLRVAHQQCHLGTDTVSLARLGAEVVGLDLSPSALAVARDLADRTGDAARFVRADVHDAVDVLGGDVDLVYATVGIVGWLPSMRRWAQCADRVHHRGDAPERPNLAGDKRRRPSGRGPAARILSDLGLLLRRTRV
jgi:SAM-dependent methyltransferase